jgi:23S rRNA pseudouridine1911/1915/1917 synthase
VRPPKPDPRVVPRVLHADPDIIIVDKPHGLPMHPGPEHGSNTLLNGLVHAFPELLALEGHGLVSRLDRETSGVVVVARSARAYAALVSAFTDRTVDKRYRALVKGTPRTPTGRVDARVEEREAVSEWEVLDVAAKAKWVMSMLALHPLTGRKHQLRIHLASIGCPVLGDRKHGATSMPMAQQVGLKRVALHAERLAFTHPGSGERVTFESPWPAELETAWRFAKQVVASP